MTLILPKRTGIVVVAVVVVVVVCLESLVISHHGDQRQTQPREAWTTRTKIPWNDFFAGSESCGHGYRTTYVRHYTE